MELRHGSGNNFVYLDTHVEFHKMNYTAPNYGIPPWPLAWRDIKGGPGWDTSTRPPPRSPHSLIGK
jgi:prepilin-type processing-associated H-X9-DG protein